jgi:hypothetical protein
MHSPRARQLKRQVRRRAAVCVQSVTVCAGGLLVLLPASRVDAFIRDVSAGQGAPVWRVGELVAADTLADRDAYFADGFTLLEV